MVCWLLVLFILLAGREAYAQTVVEIEVRGVQAIDEETIRSLLITRVGDEFSPDTIRRDIHALYESGYVKDVEVDMRRVDGGVVLTYTIKEKPIIHEVRFEGADKLSEDELDALSDLKARSVYDPAKVSELKSKLIDEYSRKGYFMVRVDIEIIEVGPNQVDVVFNVSEGKMPTVKDIEFFGNEEISDQDLRRRMTTKKEGVFSAQKYSREDFLRDQYVLDFYYDDNGYIEAAFDPPERVISEDREHVYLGMSVNEGVQYYVGAIKIEGDLIAPEDELKEGFALQGGDVFRKSLFMRDQQYLLDRYGTEGYALAQIEPDMKLRRAEQKVDITWVVIKGSKVYIERINVTGNEKTYDKVIRRELVVKEGQLYSTAEVRRSEARIKQLGYFSDVQSKSPSRRGPRGHSSSAPGSPPPQSTSSRCSTTSRTSSESAPTSASRQ